MRFLPKLGLIITPLFVAGFSLPAPAPAQTVCLPERAAVLAELASKYREVPVARGLTQTGSVLEVLSAPGGSWTAIVSKPGGPTCIVAYGEAWQEVEREVEREIESQPDPSPSGSLGDGG